jgi:small subunit ribosomal protein S6
MRAYELVFIVHPDLDENAFNDVVERVQGWITEGSGEVEKVDLWGIKDLAYPIRKQTQGHYVLMNINMAPEFGVELERNLRLQEPVMRFLMIQK